MKSQQLPLAFVALCVAVAACEKRPAAPAERRLEARREVLLEYLEQPERVPFGDALLVLREVALDRLAAATLPVEVEIDRKYLLRAEDARVTLETGVALIDISVHASLIDQPAVSAELSVLGAIDFGPGGSDDDPALAGPVVGRVEIFGLDTRDIRVGTLSPPAEALVDGLARANLAKLNSLLEFIPIPLRLAEIIHLPAVEGDVVTISAATLDAVFTLRSIRVLPDGVMISFDVDRSSGAWKEAFPWAVAP